MPPNIINLVISELPEAGADVGLEVVPPQAELLARTHLEDGTRWMLSFNSYSESGVFCLDQHKKNNNDQPKSVCYIFAF